MKCPRNPHKRQERTLRWLFETISSGSCSSYSSYVESLIDSFVWEAALTALSPPPPRENNSPHTDAGLASVVNVGRHDKVPGLIPGSNEAMLVLLFLLGASEHSHGKDRSLPILRPDPRVGSSGHSQTPAISHRSIGSCGNHTH